jgi:hypothetical protein
MRVVVVMVCGLLSIETPTQAAVCHPTITPAPREPRRPRWQGARLHGLLASTFDPHLEPRMRHALAAALAATLLLSACSGEEEEGPDMQPGSNCMSCHTGGDAPAFTAAGTVFAGGDLTVGVGGATVTITPATGRPVELITRASGNFYTNLPLTPPLTIVVSAGGFTNPMSSSASSGACGACHAPAATGAGARARVHVGTCGNCH